MSIFIVIFFILCLYHFIVDGIIAPSIRLSIRYKLFAIRDELRKIKIEQGEKFDNSVFEISDAAMCRSIHNLSKLTIYSLITNRLYIKTNEKLRKELDARILKIEQYNDPRIKELNDKANSYCANALLVNSWGWVPYLLPIVILVLILAQLGIFVFKMKNLIQELSFSPNKEFDYQNNEIFIPKLS